MKMRSARTIFFGSLVMMAVLLGIGANRYASIDEVVVSRAETTEKVVAVTIDDGPHDKATPHMLDALRETGIKATFFILGKSAEEYPDLVRQTIADGHEIATHGYSHRNMARMSQAECEEEWEKAERILAELGAQAKLFRPPGGAYGEALVKGESFEKLAEGHYTAKAIVSLAVRYGVDMPICHCVYSIIYEGKDADIALGELFGRSIKSEFYK
jgi:peptidoglycan/xylan/chitin deacetylase (PgdA/CDA1 family)